MPKFSLTQICPCSTCSPSQQLIQIVDGDAQAWKDKANSNPHVHTCNTCGCTYKHEDDGTPASSGGSIKMKDEARPQVSSLDTVNGPVAGGTTTRLTGHGFDVVGAPPTVKFNGITGTGVVVVDRDHVDVITPAGTIGLNVVEKSAGPLQVGEIVTGSLSSKTATVDQVSPLRISSPSGAFVADDVLTGGTSAETVTLDGTTPMDGKVDVSVENSHGQLKTGAVLVAGYDYTI